MASSTYRSKHGQDEIGTSCQAKKQVSSQELLAHSKGPARRPRSAPGQIWDNLNTSKNNNCN